VTDTAISPDASTDEILSDVRAWLSKSWDPDLTVAEWWERMGLEGWSAPGLPTNAYGKAISRADAVAVATEIGNFGALGAPAGLGLLLAAPTIATHGSQEQIDLFVRDIVTGQKAWCQLFSEPQAGSDLAGLQTKAIKDGDEWIINGQKVWTSGGQYADMAMLLARTDPEVPKHQGISYFAFEMHQPGVDVRPLKEMTGHALFNEVFLTDARVADASLIGGLNNGWAAANTTLMNERAGLGSGGGNAAGGGLAQPGTVMGYLSKRVGDLVAPKDAAGKGKGKGTSKGGGGSGGGALGAMRGGAGMLIALAQSKGVNKDAGIRQDLARLHTLGELGRYNGLRVKAAKEQGKDIPGMPNISKLSMSQIVRLTRDLGLRISGPSGMLHAYDADDKAALVHATGDPFAGGVTEMALFAQAPPIYGGTDQVQRNIIGERVLGLPKEPNNDRVTPFSELPKNA
jgi:alkylation response protein AidB-like acyl-CoA dehydrogenase